MNILDKTRCIFIGPMDSCRDKGRNLREYVSDELRKIGITTWNHYDNPIEGTFDEGDDEMFSKMAKAKEEGRFEEIAKYRQIRLNDLSLIDKCDFIICHLDMEKPMCGTWEELFWSIRQKKTIFIYCEQGKKSIPSWIWWSVKLDYVYNDLDEILETIKKIDSGEIPINSQTWKLLRKDFR